ncbi:MAG TPA: STAS domain-containing protein [Herpetosiphonaceae bacterium]
MARFVSLYREHFEEVVAETTERVIKEAGGMYASLTPAELRPRVVTGLDALAQDLAEPVPHYFGEFWTTMSYHRAREGYTIAELQRTITIVEEVARQLFHREIDDLAERLAAIEQLYTATGATRAIMFESFVRANEEVIRAQAAIVQELSSPIIPIYEGILVLPLVGAIDSRRAGQIMEHLLESITTYQASVVMLDVTGVPVIDTSVASYLLQTAQAVRLLGSQVILVGIRPEIAQTMVQLGIDLSDMVARANLQSGLEYALAGRGMAIQATA